MIKRLEDWIIKQGYTLNKSKSAFDSVDSKKKIVSLNTRSSIQKQLFSLLHECGHLLTRKNKKKFYKEFKVLADLEDVVSDKKPLRFYILELEDETRAWRFGLKLAKQLEIPLNIEKYNAYADKCILTYMQHGVDSLRGNL